MKRLAALPTFGTTLAAFDAQGASWRVDNYGRSPRRSPQASA